MSDQARRLPRLISTLNYADARVMRSAVFPKFAGNASKAADWTPAWSFRVVCQSWGRWLEQAAAAGLRTTADQLNKAHYCPPPGFVIRRRSRPCNLSRSCPFCYMRDAVRPVWASVQSFRNDTEHFDERYRLCDYTERIHLPDCSATAAVSELRRFKRRHKLQFAGAAGRAFNAVLEPAADGYVLSLRDLLIFNVADVAAMTSRFDGRTHRVICRGSPLTFTELRKSVVRVCGYPIGLITGDLAASVAALNEMQSKRVRSIEFSGVLRGRSAYGLISKPRE